MDAYDELFEKSRNKRNSTLSCEDDSEKAVTFEGVSNVTEDVTGVGAVRKCWAFCASKGCGPGRVADVPDYAALVESGLKASEADLCMPAAFFLQAWEVVMGCAQYELEGTCKKYGVYWRRRLDREAREILGGKIRARLKGEG